VRPFHVIRWGRENDSGCAETSLHDGGRTGSRLDFSETGGGTLSRRISGRDISGANGYATGNASRQYSTSRHFELILKLLLRMSDPDLRTGTKSRHQSRQNLSEPLNNDLEPPYGQKNHTEQSNPRANGAFLRGMRELLNDANTTPVS
jgi:hypothetical protein